MSLDVEFAPAVVVRAAGWPLAALDRLADSQLAQQAACATPSDAAGWDAYVVAHAAATRHARGQLWDATCGDARFMRALTVCNPEFAERAGRLQRDAPRNKRVRHAETSLYRYLARAAGRTEPCDLWSGVTLADWGPATSVMPQPEHALFSPDLRPFQALLRALARTPAYRTLGTFMVNVTLAPQSGGAVSFWTREPDGSVHRVSLPVSHGTGVLIDVLRGQSARSLPQWVELICERVVIDAATAERALLSLLRAGVLIGGIDLPCRFTSAWEALAESQALLVGEHRRAWLHAYALLRRLGRKLAFAGALQPDEIRGLLARAAAAIRTLADALGVECPPLPRAALRADMRLPYAISLGPELRVDLERAFEQYARHQAAFGLGVCLRQAALTSARGATDSQALDALVLLAPAEDTQEDARGETALQTWERHALRLGAGEDFARRLAQWRTWIASAAPITAAAGTEPEPGPPFGCLLFGASAQGLSIHGVMDEFAPVYARYPRLWSAGPLPPRDALYPWFVGCLRRVERETGIAIAELLTPCEGNPNVLARPAITDTTLGAWVALGSETAIALAGCRLALDPATGTRLLRCVDPKTGRGRDVAVFSFASANVGQGDPVCEQLLSTSFRVLQMANLRADAVPFACELEAGQPSAEVRLEGGAVVRARRTLICGAALRQLLVASAPERFAHWQRLAREHDWGRRVCVRRDGEAPVFVPVDSPLALEAVLEGAGSTQILCVEEPRDQAFISDAEGQTYVAQFALPFHRPRHVWSARARAPAREPLVPSERPAAAR